MIKPVATVSVTPNLPPRLERFREIAYNLRWSWHHDTIALFRRLSPDLWRETGHNPILMLGMVSQERLQEVAEDEAFLAHLDNVCDSFDRYMKSTDSAWYPNESDHPAGTTAQPVIAYFSTEFGLTECLRNYSGGLGILSGDHLKSASTLGLPLVGIGVLYQEGYFSQYLNADGYQQEAYPVNDYPNLPVTKVMGADGQRLLVKLPLPGRTLCAQIWKVQVGRVPLYLLDTNIPDNTLAEDRNLTDRLYGGDRRQRIRQEFLLGIGGVQALHLLGMAPKVYHMNEGHSAFLGLERIRLMMVDHPELTFDQAREICTVGNVFTTHTPVAAGLERFGFDLVDEHLSYMWQALGLTRDQFFDLGRESMGSYDLFSMAVLAINLSAAANGVAKLHGEVSRELWQWMYPNVPVDEVPVGHVTNGIHVETWVSAEMSALYDRYLDPAWRDMPDDMNVWEQIERIPDTELWRTHERRRESLVSYCRQQLRDDLIARGAPQSDIEIADEVLSPDALTIGFARRVATYKRATLLFSDLDRLARILNNEDRPVQIIFAGKAHPSDLPAKAYIQAIVNTARNTSFRHKIVFLENYDMAVGRVLVQGVDVWLNNPRRPMEASGTSGMKVIYNGGLNASILDGWWAEGYDRSVGWAIGNGEQYAANAEDLQDKIESQALYNLIENDIVPLFYDRNRDNVPRAWIDKVKSSIAKLAPFFNTDRMVKQYTTHYYVPAATHFTTLTEPDLSKGLAFADWRARLKAAWPEVKVSKIETSGGDQIKIGSAQHVTARVALGSLLPEDVLVQVYYGDLDAAGSIVNGETIDMELIADLTTKTLGTYAFQADVHYKTTGQHGLSVRVLPHNPNLLTPFLRGIVAWAG